MGQPSNLPAPADPQPTLLPDFGLSTLSLPTGPPATPTPQTGCPTVTATRELCQTCAIPLCLGLATVTQSCGCPSAIPTVYLDFPCKDNCKGVWCSTSYAIVTATETCKSGGPPKPTPTLPTAGISQSTSGGGAKPTTKEPVVTAAAARVAVPILGGLF